MCPSNPASVADAATVIVDHRHGPRTSWRNRFSPPSRAWRTTCCRTCRTISLSSFDPRCPPEPRTGLYDYLRANGRNPKVSFCPERIVQGQAIQEIRLLTQIVSGTTKEAEWKAAALFERISPRIVRLTPIRSRIREAVQQRVTGIFSLQPQTSSI